MHAGIPGIGLGGLFFVLSTFVMLAIEIVRTVQGRSSVARWRLVGRQTGIASTIVLVTTLMLWLLDVLFLPPGDEIASTANGESGGRFIEFVSALPLAAAPILGTLMLLVVVLVLAETARLYVAERPADHRSKRSSPRSSDLP